jgi:hypothetical protein
MLSVKKSPRLRVELRCSPRLRAAIVVATLATLLLVACQPLSLPLKAAGLVFVAGSAARAARRCVGGGVPLLVHLGQDHRLTVIDRQGRPRDGTVLPGTYVGAHCVSIVWRCDATARERAGRAVSTLLIVPDMLSPELFRDLRVRLRHGRAHAAPSGTPSNRPASQSRPSNTRPLPPPR